ELLGIIYSTFSAAPECKSRATGMIPRLSDVTRWPCMVRGCPKNEDETQIRAAVIMVRFKAIRGQSMRWQELRCREVGMLLPGRCYMLFPLRSPFSSILLAKQSKNGALSKCSQFG